MLLKEGIRRFHKENEKYLYSLISTWRDEVPARVCVPMLMSQVLPHGERLVAMRVR